LFQRPNLTHHGKAEFWIGGRKCLYDYPIGASKYLEFYDYLWVPKNQEGGKVPPENIFCNVGQIHHWYTHRFKTVKTGKGDAKKNVSLSGECWDVMNEKPQQRMGFLERPFNVWTNKFMVEGSDPLHKRILEMEEAQMLTSYRNYYLERQLQREPDQGKANCNFETYGLNNTDVQMVNERSIPFCVNLATYADPTKVNSYNRDEEPEWTWYSHPCHWRSLFICEAEMDTDDDDVQKNKMEFTRNQKEIHRYWEKNGGADPTPRSLFKDSA